MVCRVVTLCTASFGSFGLVMMICFCAPPPPAGKEAVGRGIEKNWKIFVKMSHHPEPLAPRCSQTLPIPSPALCFIHRLHLVPACSAPRSRQNNAPRADLRPLRDPWGPVGAPMPRTLSLASLSTVISHAVMNACRLRLLVSHPRRQAVCSADWGGALGPAGGQTMVSESI